MSKVHARHEVDSGFGRSINMNVAEAGAILECLEYLQGEALKNGYRMAAHLIGAASEDMKDRIWRIQHKQIPS
jgi:hypothetical protein